MAKPDRAWCYRCGAVWPKKAVTCVGCGSTDRVTGRTRPQMQPKQMHATYPYPWDLIPWPTQGAACIFGGPGGGKSTLASIVRPTLWMTKEQEHAPVGDMFRRTCPGFMPQVAVVETAEDVERELSTTERGPVVLDSLTALGPRDALLAAHLMVHWARHNNDRSLSIIQVNKEGDAAGYREITHLFDCVVDISPDPWGLRVFNVDKSRWCGLFSRYWIFDGNGQVSVPSFPASYSVEGRPGNYYLHPFPMKGATWNGLLTFLAAEERLHPGIASAASPARYMPHGFVEPYDLAERKRFAEAHGLRWVGPQDAFPSGLPPETKKKGKSEPSFDDDDFDDAERDESPPSATKKTPKSRKTSPRHSEAPSVAANSDENPPTPEEA